MAHEPEPQPPSRPNFPQIEEEIAAFWEKHKIFERSIEERPASKTFAFYDGPPFATGLPHYGHLLQSAIKDAVPRYFTMRGYRVPRRWGWDCHGLPVETLTEKALKLNSKRDIESYGIEKFNAACHTSVMEYAGEWKKYVARLGRWVDFDGAYKTMDASYIESVWWSFAELWKKKLIYKDLRVSFFCPRCSTPLSNFEIAMGNSYVDAQDPSVVIKFKVKNEPNTYLLAWTTTPWTLPANVALAVHPDEIYVKVRMGDTGETLLFADKLLSSALREHFPLPTDGEVPFEVIEKMRGSQLEGMEYEPLYPLSPESLQRVTAREGKTIYRVVGMEYVSMTDGTGIVHTAPAFGEEDFLASKTHKLPVLVTVDEEGHQRPELPIAEGLPIKESDAVVMADLDARGLLFRRETVTHSVPVCWRCSTQLLYKAQPAWFVNVTKLKSKILDSAKKIHWHPEHFKEGRFGKGLETAPDWCISRTRYWGAPLPVWSCDRCGVPSVFGSLADLERAAGKEIKTGKDGLRLHRPFIDDVTIACQCGGRSSRIPDVFDCWYESGSMPFASIHYPFENKKWFDGHFPADFIAEGQDQTRGWFYSLHVLGSALTGKPAFRDAIVTGLLMGEDGKKMSKSLKNYPDPWDLMVRLGADTLRLYLLSSPVVAAEQLNFSERDCETLQRTLFGTLWNVRAFYLMVAGTHQVEIKKPKSAHVLDRWLLARLASVTGEMTNAMESFDLVAATRPLRKWADDLSTWWLRRSRERLKSDNAYEREDALRTLREALLVTSELLAPFAPFFAEKLYQDLNGAKMSVHLDKWPKADRRLIDAQLSEDMAWSRDVARAAHELRARHKLPVRQALASLTVRLKDPALAGRLVSRTDLLILLRDETNVERVSILGGEETGAEPWLVELDTVITPELKKKGFARELSRHVMNLRKELRLAPVDAITLSFATPDQGLRDTIEALSDALAKDVKAKTVNVGDDLPASSAAEESFETEGISIRIGIQRA